MENFNLPAEKIKKYIEYDVFYGCFFQTVDRI